MSMFHAARSVSLTGWPKRGLSGKGCTACGPEAPSGMPLDDFAAMPPPPRFTHPKTDNDATTMVRINSALANRIAHLAFCVDRPRLNAVVVLHEARDGARFLDFLHRRLHIARTVDCAAHQDRGRAIPVPPDLEAREAFVHDRFLDLGLA